MVIAVILASKLDTLSLPNGWSVNDFTDISSENIDYNVVHTFDSYFYDLEFSAKFDFVFYNDKDYADWVNKGQYNYFLIPTDFIAYIEHYAGWVKEVHPELAFNITCELKDITIEGENVTMPTSVVNVIPCCVTHWTDDGLMVLAGVIGSWNNQNPSKIINIPYTFESYNDLIAFRNEHL